MINVIIHTLKEAGIEIEYDRNNKVKIIRIRGVSPLPTPSSLTENQAQNEAPGSDDIGDDASKIDSPSSLLSSPNFAQIHAQIGATDDSYDSDDGLHTNNIDPNKRIKCPDCDYWDQPYYMRINHFRNTGHG